MNGRFIYRILLLILLIAMATYLAVHYEIYSILASKQKVISLIYSFHPYDECAFIAIQILQVLAAPIPGEVTGLIGGYLYGPLVGTIHSTIGLTVGSWLAFSFARFFGLPLVEKIVKPEIIRKYDYFLEHRGAFFSFLCFLTPGFPKDCLCYIMGLSHMVTWHFLIISTTGRILGTVLLSVSGSYARNNQYLQLLIITGISCIFIIAAYFYRDKWQEALRKRHKKSTSNIAKECLNSQKQTDHQKP